MKSFNQADVAGMVCRDPELKYSGSGTAFCSWSMATSRKRGEEERTTWWRVTAFGKTAELAGEYLKKGSNVFVSGEVELEEYTDKDGHKRSSLVLNVNNMRFLDGKSDAGAQPQAKAATQGAPAGSDDDIPF